MSTIRPCRPDEKLVARSAVPSLLRTYWSIPDRQVETSVALASTPLGTGGDLA